MGLVETPLMKLAIVTHKTRHGLCKVDSVPWQHFAQHSLPPTLTLNDCQILDGTAKSPNDLRPDISHVLVLGRKSLINWLPEGYRAIFKSRGNLLRVAGRLTTVSFNPQDAADFSMHDMESDSNEDAEVTARQEKDDNTVRPCNWRWWISKDTTKLVQTPEDFRFPLEPINLYTPVEEAIRKLLVARNQHLFLDIETRFDDAQLDCIGFAVDDDTANVVCIYNYDNQLEHGKEDTRRFLAALGQAMCRNTVVVHNAMFDLWVLCFYYHLPFGRRIFDTMCAHHRAWPEVEKSLGHCVSLYTRLPFHKDEYRVPTTERMQTALWKYNGKDVYSMRAVWKELVKQGAELPGLASSMESANASVHPYLVMSLQGFPVDKPRLLSTRDELKARLVQFDRVRKLLITGHDFNPRSSLQCIELLHEQLNAPVVSRSHKTRMPKLDNKALYKILAKVDDKKTQGIVNFIIQYRLLAKSIDTVTFNEYPGIQHRPER